VANRAREVIFSLNAVDELDYHRMMKAQPATFHRVVANIQGLVQERQSSQHPNIVVQFLIDRENCHELPRMYRLGRCLAVDRIVVSTVQEIPLGRIDASVLLEPKHVDLVRAGLREVLAADRDARLLQIDFPIAGWNALVEELKLQVGYPALPPLLPVAASFRDENGHCFFSWYTATIRGNGDVYPCCQLMVPDYKPLGNAVAMSATEIWNGPAFAQMRREQRGVLLEGSDSKFDPAQHTIIRRQCVDQGLCWLKNVYFRGDESFYADLGDALTHARRRGRWRRSVALATARYFRTAKRVGNALRRRLRKAVGRVA
jgi:MoaA/NifB/PqqE/SkfB family radical SAM enzyme